jgi:hypothetical protein
VVKSDAGGAFGVEWEDDSPEALSAGGAGGPFGDDEDSPEELPAGGGLGGA